MSMLRTCVRGLFGILLVPGLSLAAANPVHYGFSAQVNFPLADLDTDIHGKVGAGASFQVSIETSGRTIIRPRLDIDTFPVSEHARPFTTFRDRVDLSSVGLGADFLYSFNGRNDQGLYGLGGIGVQRWIQSRSSRDTESHWDTWHNDDTLHNRTTPWLALGLGYQFNPIVGLETRFVGSKYDALDITTSGTRTAVVGQLALTCRW